MPLWMAGSTIDMQCPMWTAEALLMGRTSRFDTSCVELLPRVQLCKQAVGSIGK